MNNRHEEKNGAAGYRFRDLGSAASDSEPFKSASDPVEDRRTESPFFRALDSLAAVFERETDALREGDFAKFKKVQGEKLLAIRHIEKMQKNASSAFSDLRREEIENRLSHFNATIDKNMKTLDAMRTAVSSVKKYAMKAIEDRQSDGVYAKDGALRGPARLSATAGNQIKL
jgi:hypothetical protein